MKTKFIALALAGVFALSASAQEVRTSSNLADQPGKNVTFQRNNTGDNWFISVRGGMNHLVPFGGERKVHSTYENGTFLDKFGWNASFGFGKWYTPYFATRMVIDITETRDPFAANLNNVKVVSKELKDQADIDFYGFNPHIDFMFNPANYFGVYNAERTVSFVPYIGVGVFARRTAGTNTIYDGIGDYFSSNSLKDINYAVSGNLGFDLGFRLSRVVNLVVAPSLVFSNLLPVVETSAYNGNEMLAKIDLGLDFNLGKSDFEVIEPMDYALVNSLQSEVNSLRSQNAELSKRPVRCPECPEVAPVTAQLKSENVVFFRIGSAKIDRNQMGNIFNTAEFVKANNIPVTVVGYADAQTGSSEFNMQLSEKRAREVARVLTDEYGVPSSQITIDYKGDTVQPYAENSWNRVVIMTAEK